jgi:hypothetical protein
MVVKFTKDGLTVHGPPYTKAEEDEFYRRVGRGPVTVARPVGDRKEPTSPQQQQPCNGFYGRQNNTGAGLTMGEACPASKRAPE